MTLQHNWNKALINFPAPRRLISSGNSEIPIYFLHLSNQAGDFFGNFVVIQC